MNDRSVGAWDEIAQLIQAIGRPQFAAECLAFLARHTGTDHLALLLFGRELKPNLIAGASPPNRNIVFETAKEYSRHYYLSDPNVRYISQHLDHSGVPVMFRITMEDIRDARYREQIYERRGLLERVSWIGIAGDTWYSANLYRDQSSGRYTADELESLHSMGSMLCALFEQHILRAPDIPLTHGRPSLEYLQSLVTELHAGLSQREIEVCARALLGMTRTGIALDLDIKPSTVATLTQRAHGKLDISSLNELFALCLQVLHTRNTDRQ